MEGTDRETRPAGRSVNVLVFGNSADEIELAALDKARPFFGEHAQLEVVRNWSAGTNADAWANTERYRERAVGKTYSAHVTVRTIETPGDPS